MTRGPCTFRQRDVARLVRAATAAGLHVTGVRVSPQGEITVVTGEAGAQDSKDHGREGNEWDTILNVQ